ncbi:MAG TPA: asparagine synthase (glutamine-hydrolyzing) [Verrucomicrobiae bacterium]|nr:asparagine synthase (glutamine-hydrolyzing) [Verrucomicrobiae bacterium]
MCGICGTVSLSGFADPESASLRVEAMLRSLAHRGPDDVGKVETDAAVLGMTRLAIRGVKDVNQPMVDAETGVIAVCNGEIDNHRDLRHWLAERGRPVHRETDVGVIPGLYLELDEDFASRMVGAFAVAVWDPRTGRLILARDRTGERPLFFASRGGQTHFATEIAALVSHSRLPIHLDQDALKKYLQFGIFPSPETPFAEIRKVAPGETIRIDKAGVRRKRYWRWQIAETAKKPASLDAFDQTFRAAVGRQSQVEVDFGVFLSGGIDSSLVSAVVRSLHPQRALKAYTLRFEERTFDEGGFAEAVAKQLKMELVTVWVKPGDVRDGLRTLIRLVGEPLADPAWIPAALLARRAAQDVKVALVGEGADELFGGYPTYIGAAVAERFSRLPGWLKSAIRRLVLALPQSEKKMTISFLLKRFVNGADLDGMTRHRFWVSNIAPELLWRLGVGPTDPESPDAGCGHLLDRVQRWDLETSLAEGLLTKADRASMSSALELRAPFLDEAVMDFAKSLPVEDRVRGFNTKVFLKRYARRYLPDEIVNRRKRGLSVPISRWLRGPLKNWASATLECGRLEQAGIQTSAAKELFFEHCHGQADHGRAVWTLLVLGEWLDWVGTETDSSSSLRQTGRDPEEILRAL